MTTTTLTASNASEASFASPVTLIRTGEIDGTNSVTIEPEEESINVTPDFQIAVLDKTVKRAPTSITVTVDGGVPDTDITFLMDSGDDGTDGAVASWTTTLDSDGGLQPTSLTVTGTLGGQKGNRTLVAHQTLPDTTVVGATDTYSVAVDPVIAETTQGSDAQAIDIPGAVINGVRHWVFQDLLAEEDGGIGSYILPINPRTMTSPHLEFAVTARHTTSHDGIFHIFQAGNIPKDWSFTGYAPTEEMVEKLEQYRDLNRRFYVIDHHNRAWKVLFESVDIVPRLRHVYNGEVTDWGTDFTVAATIVDQDWVTPA